MMKESNLRDSPLDYSLDGSKTIDYPTDLIILRQFPYNRHAVVDDKIDLSRERL